MKITIRTNGKIIAGNIVRNFNGEIWGIEADFTPAEIGSDMEIWLEDSDGKICDYAKMKLSAKKKMRFAKG